MIQPQPIGGFLKCDDSGFIIPDVSLSKISNSWKEPVEFIATELKKLPHVQSLYLRGSVPRGLAINEISDLDFLVFVSEKMKIDETALESELVSKFQFVKGLELTSLDKNDFLKISKPQQRPYFQMLVKTQGLFIFGEDYCSQISPFKPGIEMVSHCFSIDKEFQKLPQWLIEDRKKGLEKNTVKWFSRRVVRSGFEITMAHESNYTRDLYFCFEQFSIYYPQYRSMMHSVLLNSLNGDQDPSISEKIIDLISNERNRLI